MKFVDKPPDLSENTVSTTMLPARSPCGGTADATDLKSVSTPAQPTADSTTYDDPAKNSASCLAQMAVKYPDLEKLARLWPDLPADVRKMISGVAGMTAVKTK